MAAEVLKFISGGVVLAVYQAAEEPAADVAPALWIHPDSDSTSDDGNTQSEQWLDLTGIKDAAVDRTFAVGTGDAPPRIRSYPRSLWVGGTVDGGTDAGFSASGGAVGSASEHAALLALWYFAGRNRESIFWAERGSDGRFVAGLDDEDRPFIEYADSDGSNPVRATCPDSIHGTATITDADLTTVTDSITDPGTSTVHSNDRVVCVLTLAGHATWPVGHRFEHNDRVRLAGCGDPYDGDWTVVGVDLDANTITLSVDYEGGTAPSFTLGTVRRLGVNEWVSAGLDWGNIRSLDDLGESTYRTAYYFPVALSWDRSSDGTVEWRVGGHPIGTDTLSSPSATGPSAGVTTYLLKSPDADDAPDDFYLRSLKAWASIPPDAQMKREEIEASVLAMASRGFGPFGLRLSYWYLAHVTPGEREHLRCVTLFRNTTSGELVSGNDSPFASRPWMNSYSAQPGLNVNHVLGTGEETTEQEFEVILVAWNAPHDAGGTAQAAELIHAGVVRRFTVLPWPAGDTTDYYCSWSEHLPGNDGLSEELPLAHPVDVPSPGPFTRIFLKEGETFPTDSKWTFAPDAGPILVSTYGTAGTRPVLSSSTNAFLLELGGTGLRIKGIRAETTKATGGQFVAWASGIGLTLTDVEIGVDGEQGGIEGAGSELTLDRVVLDDAGNVPAYYGILADGFSGVSITRLDASNWRAKTGAHPVRIQAWRDFLLGFVDQGRSDTEGQVSLRFKGVHGTAENVAAEVTFGVFGLSNESTWASASHGLQIEQCDVNDLRISEHVGAEVRGVISRTDGDIDAVATHSRYGSARCRVHSSRSKTGPFIKTTGSADWQVNPSTAPWANVNNSSEEFGTLAAPDVAVAAGVDGVVGLVAAGGLVGGTGMARCRWERRPAAGGSWTTLPGLRGPIAADVPGDGSWEYRVSILDEDDDEDAGQAETVSVSGTVD